MFSQENMSCIQDALHDAIQSLHDGSLYHNDMNQRNVILWTDGKIYIIDFDKSSHQKPPQDKLFSSFFDPRYIRTYKWKMLDGDFNIIKYFNSLIK
jgi:RIO-like serine/threonine protein kinase